MSIISEALKKAEKNRIGQVIVKTPPSKKIAAPLTKSTTKSETETVRFSGSKIAWGWNWEAFTCWSLVAGVVALLAGLFHFPPPHTGFAFHADVTRIASISNPIQTGFLTGKAIRPTDIKFGKTKVVPYRLTGIIVSLDGNPYAIVNETVVRTGDYLDGAYVKTISNGEVVLDSVEGEQKLHIAI